MAEKLTAEEQFDALKNALNSLTDTVTQFIGNFAKMASDAAKNIGDDTKDFSDDMGGILQKATKSIAGFDSSKMASLARKQMENFNTNFLDLYSKKLGAGGLSPAKVKDAIEAILKGMDIKAEFGLTESQYKDFVKNLQKLVKENENLILTFKDAVSDLARDMMKPFDKLIGWIEKLPGGKLLSAAFDLDKMKKDIETKIKTELAKAYEEGVRGFKLIGEAGKSAFKSIGAAIVANPMLLVFGAVSLLLYGMVKLGKRYLDVMKGIRDQTGLVAKDAAELAKVSRDVAGEWSNLGLDMEAAGKATGAIVNEFQIMDVATRDMIEGVGAMVGILGVGEQSAAKVARMFEVMKGASTATTIQMAAVVGNAAKLGGIAPAKVFEDMAQSTKEIQTYFKGSFTNAAKAAIELRRMGTSIKEASASAKSMVDFEASIGSELEASVLLGRQLDFSAARYYAFMGDIENQQKEVLKQVGSLEEFNAMMPFQKEAIAKAAGMEVDQLGNMLQQQKILAGMDSKKKQEYKDGLELLKNMQDVNEKSLLDDNKRLLATEQLKKMWDNILMALSPVFDVLYQITEWVAAIAEKSKALGIGLIAIAVIVGGVLLTAVTSLVGKLGQKISGGLMDMIFKPNFASSGVEKVAKGINIVDNSVEKFSKGAGGGWGLAKAAVGMILIAGALWIFAQALKVLSDNDKLPETLAVAVVGLAALTVVALLLGTLQGPIILGALAMVILAGAVWVLGLALQAFIPVMDAFGKLFAVLAKSLGDLATRVTFSQLAGVAGGLSLIGLALAAFGMTGIFGMFGLLQLMGTTAALSELAKLANPLNIVATSIERLGAALKILDTSKLDMDKLEEIGDIALKGKVEQTPNVTVNVPDRDDWWKKFDILIDKVGSMEVKMDGKLVGEVLADGTSNPGFGR